MIQIENVSFSYSDGTVFKDVNLRINKGDYLALLGSNGSGKSTLIKLILGLLDPTSGKIHREYDRIAYIPQQGLEDVSFPVTVNELMKFRLPRSKGSNAAISDALLRVGMQEEGKKLIQNLSGGQRQRVLIARELLIAPEVLILDEPNTGLDSKSIQSLYQLLDQLNQEEAMTIVLVTHQLDEEQRKGKRIVTVSDRNLIEVNYV